MSLPPPVVCRNCRAVGVLLARLRLLCFVCVCCVCVGLVRSVISAMDERKSVVQITHGFVVLAEQHSRGGASQASLEGVVHWRAQACAHHEFRE